MTAYTRPRLTRLHGCCPCDAVQRILPNCRPGMFGVAVPFDGGQRYVFPPLACTFDAARLLHEIRREAGSKNYRNGRRCPVCRALVSDNSKHGYCHAHFRKAPGYVARRNPRPRTGPYKRKKSGTNRWAWGVVKEKG